MAKGQKSKKKLIIFGSLAVLLVVIIGLVIAQGGKEEIIPVQMSKAEKRTITKTVTATGKIQSEFKVVINPEVTGEVVDLPVKDGDSVRQGQVLVKIKADIYLSQKQRAEAALESAKATLAMRDAELNKVTLDYNRIKELHTKKLASDSELEAAKNVYLQAKAGYDAANANVMQNIAAVREANEQLMKTTIISPLSGTVTQLNIEKGERVLGSGFSQGTNIMTVSDLSNMEAIVEVDENDIVYISKGDTARIKVDAYGDKVFRGIVTEIGNSAIQTGMGTQEQVVNFEVRVKLIDLDKNLRPGMSCNASIEVETVENVISIPIQSVTAREDMPAEQPQGETPVVNGNGKKNDKKIQEIVFSVEGGKAKIIKVETGISDDNYIEIKSGLSEGTEIVSGSYKAISRELKEGSLVKVESNGGGGAPAGQK
ncbi:MAG: efflux RND transporter periplasmic adaptor subunit [Ignavibacteriaceae bacterium]|nr:efflux RND transporter periplasmic adaptor subunit [Ignavibacteriaceae bacterium]NUM70611.1 efflux RND transporter periplasmic adaptor subunit [Ignavibacteriaceae bacterium]